MRQRKLFHHLGIAAGLIGLGLWYLAADQLGLMRAISSFFPESHVGAGLMIAIMICMTPGFLLWKFYNRWLERKLEITGRYYEDDYYKSKKE